MTTTERHYEMLTDTGPHSPERDAPLDAVFGAVADARCRAVLDHLAESDARSVALDDLAARLADDSGDALAACLHHTLLPKLADAGFLDYDADAGTVRYRPDDRLEAVLATVDRELGDDPAVAPGALFDALGEFRRRNALATLLVHGELPLPDLADEVAVAERDRPLSEIDPEAVLDVYLSLYHNHVPKLVDVGLVAYDQERDFVALTDTGRALDATIRALCDPGE